MIRLVSSDGETMRLIEVGTAIKTLRWSSDGADLVVVTDQSRVLALDTAADSSPVEVLAPGAAPIFVSNSGEHLLGAPERGLLRLWRVDGTNPLVTVAEHFADLPTRVAWSRNTQALAYATTDGGVYLWDRPGRNERVELMHGQEEVHALEFSRDDKSLFVGTESGIRVVRLDRLDLGPGPLLGGNYLRSFATFEGTDTLLSAHGSGTIWAWSGAALRAGVGATPKMCIPRDLQHHLLGDISTMSPGDDCDVSRKFLIQERVRFTGVGRRLNAKDYDLIGKKVRLRCWIAVEQGAESGARLYLRTDRANGTISFIENSQLVQDEQWREVVLDGHVGTDAELVNFGAFALGETEGRFRNLTFDVWRNGGWAPVSAPNIGFERGIDKEWNAIGSRDFGEISVDNGILRTSWRADRKWLKQALKFEPGRWSALRVRAWMRVEQATREDSGNLMVGHWGSRSAEGTLSSIKIDSPVWNQYTVHQDLSPSQSSIDVLITLSRNGRIWIDEVTVEGKAAEGKWEPVDLRNLGFEEGEAGWTHSEHAGVRLTRASYHGRYALELGPP